MFTFRPLDRPGWHSDTADPTMGYVKAKRDETDRITVRVPVEGENEDGETTTETEVHEVSFSDNNLAQVPSHVETYLVESDRFDVESHTSNGGED